MDTQTHFYAPPETVRGDWLVLPEGEAHHAVRVLRRQVGEEVVVVDGEGGWYRVVLRQVDKRQAAGEVVERRREVGEPDYVLRIGLALLKNENRFETFLEKAVELGVREVVPLLTARTEKSRIRQVRAQNILLAAMKQCGRSRLPRLTPPQALEDVLAAGNGGRAFICHEQVDPARTILSALARPVEAKELRILVGPEGGFTDEEVAAAQQAGFEPVALGPRRLRAETAALVAASAVMLARADDSL